VIYAKVLSLTVLWCHISLDLTQSMVSPLAGDIVLVWGKIPSSWLREDSEFVYMGFYSRLSVSLKKESVTGPKSRVVYTVDHWVHGRK